MTNVWTVKDLGRAPDGYFESVAVRDGIPQAGCIRGGITQRAANLRATLTVRIRAKQTKVRIGDLSQCPERWQYVVPFARDDGRHVRGWWHVMNDPRSGCTVLDRDNAGYKWEAWEVTKATWAHDSTVVRLTGHAPTLAAAKRAAERAAREMEGK